MKNRATYTVCQDSYRKENLHTVHNDFVLSNFPQRCLVFKINDKRDPCLSFLHMH